jgi:4-amino-4-deoxy-L-arabinose transferase-like glycosyltransferase
VNRSRIAVWLVSAAAGWFVLLGALLIPRAGLDADETLFTNPLYRSLSADFELGILHHKVPVMLVSYTGTLKTLLCWPILRLFSGSAFAVRLPMVLVGGATILLFFFLADSLAGRAAAVGAAVLLATDPSFLLTDTFDWGPAALEHLLLVSGCLAMASRRSTVACFLFGLALWNKATFVWALSGLAIAALVAYWPECSRRLRDRRLVIRCALALLAGALPLVLFNLHRTGATFRSSNGISTQDLNLKLHELRGAVDGSGLFGYLAAEDWATAHPKPPSSLSGQISAWIREHLGEFRSSLFPYAVALAILAAPLWWRSPARRAGVFAIVFCAVTFLSVAITRGAGTGIHHAVLLWPLPHLLAGVALSALRPRWIAPTLAIVLALSNLMVVNQYFVQFDRNGAEGNFTDAISLLSNVLEQANSIYVTDWGMYEALVFLRQGRLALHYSPALLVAENPTVGQLRATASMIADPDGLFVTHVAAREIFKGVRGRIEAVGASAGFEKHVIQTIPDSNGRPVFELWRFGRD